MKHVYLHVPFCEELCGFCTFNRNRFEEGLAWTAGLAARAQVMVALETMDTPFLNSITKWLSFAERIPAILGEAHTLFFEEPVRRLSQS